LNILGIDTATRILTVGLCRCGRIIAERSEVTAGGPAGALSRIAGAVLGDAGLSVRDLGGVAVSLGPGSFTGLRVGVSFAKGLAYAAGFPIVGVPTLPALASAAEVEEEVVATCLDARRGEVYLALYDRRTGSPVETVSPIALDPDAAGRRILEESNRGRMAVVGDAAERYPASFRALAESGVRLVSLKESPPRGGVIACRAETRIRAGERPDPASVLPLYVRPPLARPPTPTTSLTREKPV